MRRRDGFNRKRKIADTPHDLGEIASQVTYVGNPEHKRDRGDFGLTYPTWHNPDKTLCDGTGIRERAVANALLKEGARRGLISEQRRNGFPQNIWTVTEDRVPLEARLDNEEQGTYHGYPMPSSDPFRREILDRFRADDQ